MDWKMAFGLSPSQLLARGTRGVTVRCSGRKPRHLMPMNIRMCSVSTTGADASATDSGLGKTMERIRVRAIQDAEESILGTQVKVSGWLRTIRDQKKFAFLNVNDGSSLSGVQVVVDGETESYSVAKSLTTGSSVSIIGNVVKSPGKGQNYEIQAISVEVLGVADPSFPLQKKRHTFEFLRGAGEMFQVTTLPVSNPSSIAKDDSGNVDFKKDFFEKPTFLTVSGQLSAETYACALSDVYTFGPTFRAENSNTSRHLAEFWMVEPEMAFADLYDDMANAEAYIKYCVSAVLEQHAEDVEFFNKFVQKGVLEKLENVRDSVFGRISYTEAIDLLLSAKKKFEFPVEWGIDLQSEHERYLAEEHFKKPVFVYNYPAGIKAFYMRLNDDGKTVAAMDLLVPGIGELIGGSQREERLDVLERRIEEVGLEKEAYWWYLDLRRFGTVPHSGYGLGFERLVQFVTGMENIRDVIPFPRHPGNAEF